MQYVLTVVPFVLIATVVALVLARTLRGRVARPRPPRKPRSAKLTLHVSPDRMDDDLKDLLRKG
jgi:hypothetical protein